MIARPKYEGIKISECDCANQVPAYIGKMGDSGVMPRAVAGIAGELQVFLGNRCVMYIIVYPVTMSPVIMVLSVLSF